ncbi:MAG TPA: hypothetical protein VGA00_13380, partial [Acidiferrobacterales bacterium]
MNIADATNLATRRGAAGVTPCRARWTRNVLAGMTACALSLLGAAPVQAGPDACSGSGTSRTCQGDQSDGIGYTSGVATLTVTNLSDDITPALQVTGITLRSNGGDGGNGG